MLLWCVLRQKALLPRNSKLLPIFPGVEVTSPLISGPAWILRLKFTKYQQRLCPNEIFFFFFVIPLTVYIRSTELYRSQFICCIITCHGRIMPCLAELLFSIWVPVVKSSFISCYKTSVKIFWICIVHFQKFLTWLHPLLTILHD